MLELDERLIKWLADSEKYAGLSKSKNAGGNIAKIGSLVDLVANRYQQVCAKNILDKLSGNCIDLRVALEALEKASKMIKTKTDQDQVALESLKNRIVAMRQQVNALDNIATTVQFAETVNGYVTEFDLYDRMLAMVEVEPKVLHAMLNNPANQYKSPEVLLTIARQDALAQLCQGNDGGPMITVDIDGTEVRVLPMFGSYRPGEKIDGKNSITSPSGQQAGNRFRLSGIDPSWDAATLAGVNAKIVAAIGEYTANNQPTPDAEVIQAARNYTSTASTVAEGNVPDLGSDKDDVVFLDEFGNEVTLRESDFVPLEEVPATGAALVEKADDSAITKSLDEFNAALESYQNRFTAIKLGVSPDVFLLEDDPIAVAQLRELYDEFKESAEAFEKLNRDDMSGPQEIDYLGIMDDYKALENQIRGEFIVNNSVLGKPILVEDMFYQGEEEVLDAIIVEAEAPQDDPKAQVIAILDKVDQMHGAALEDELAFLNNVEMSAAEKAGLLRDKANDILMAQFNVPDASDIDESLRERRDNIDRSLANQIDNLLVFAKALEVCPDEHSTELAMDMYNAVLWDSQTHYRTQLQEYIKEQLQAENDLKAEEKAALASMLETQVPSTTDTPVVTEGGEDNKGVIEEAVADGAQNVAVKQAEVKEKPSVTLSELFSKFIEWIKSVFSRASKADAHIERLMAHDRNTLIHNANQVNGHNPKDLTGQMLPRGEIGNPSLAGEFSPLINKLAAANESFATSPITPEVMRGNFKNRRGELMMMRDIARLDDAYRKLLFEKPDDPKVVDAYRSFCIQYKAYLSKVTPEATFRAQYNIHLKFLMDNKAYIASYDKTIPPVAALTQELLASPDHAAIYLRQASEMTNTQKALALVSNVRQAAFNAMSSINFQNAEANNIQLVEALSQYVKQAEGTIHAYEAASDKANFDFAQSLGFTEATASTPGESEFVTNADIDALMIDILDNQDNYTNAQIYEKLTDFRNAHKLPPPEQGGNELDRMQLIGLAIKMYESADDKENVDLIQALPKEGVELTSVEIVSPQHGTAVPVEMGGENDDVELTSIKTGYQGLEGFQIDDEVEDLRQKLQDANLTDVDVVHHEAAAFLANTDLKKMFKDVNSASEMNDIAEGKYKEIMALNKKIEGIRSHDDFKDNDVFKQIKGLTALLNVVKNASAQAAEARSEKMVARADSMVTEAKAILGSNSDMSTKISQLNGMSEAYAKDASAIQVEQNKETIDELDRMLDELTTGSNKEHKVAEEEDAEDQKRASGTMGKGGGTG